MKLLSTIALAVLAVFSQNASAEALSVTSMHLDSLVTVAPYDLINWKVGEIASYDVTVGAFGKLGTMVKQVTREEGNAIWVSQNLDLGFQKDSSEMLMSRVDGKILKYIHNGKEEQMPNDQPEIISQDTTEVTVPAGTFPCVHIVAKTKQVDKIEIWANPRDTVMEGSLKMVIAAQMEITMELTKFTQMP